MERLIDLSAEQTEQMEARLEEYDRNYITYRLDGSMQIGIERDDVLVAGLDACMTAFKILYVSTVFVDEAWRRMGYGRRLMEEMEKRAKAMGANTIRLDTFSWQGKDFYKALGYTQVGFYSNEEDGYEEYFFMKRI